MSLQDASVWLAPLALEPAWNDGNDRRRWDGFRMLQAGHIGCGRSPRHLLLQFLFLALLDVSFGPVEVW
jgi:hypothetical protein